MKMLSFIAIALVVILNSASRSVADESEIFSGSATASGPEKHPQLLVDGKRYELKASDKAEDPVAELLAKVSMGDTGTYIIKGTRGTVMVSRGSSSTP